MMLIGVQAILLELNDKVGAELEYYTAVDEKQTIDELRNSAEKFTHSEPSNKLIEPEDVCITSGFDDYRIINGTNFKHNAIDITGKSPTKDYKVLATHDGMVKIRELTSGYCRVGNSDYIFYEDHYLIEIYNETYKTQYLHLNDIYVVNNEIVKQGDVLGIMGNEGCSTGTHLHYAVYKMTNDKFRLVNPEPNYTDYNYCR